MRQSQLKTRSDEICSIVKLLEGMPKKNGGEKALSNLLFGEKLNKTVSIDTSQLVLAGHSFGGATSIKAANDLPSPPKAVLLLDPWFFPLQPEVKNGTLKLPCPV